MDLYAETILDHYRHPRCAGMLQEDAVRHEEVNHSCGDRITVSVRLQDGAVTAIGWEGNGCAVSQAGMSLLAETLVGARQEEILNRTAQDMLQLLGVPVGPRRMKCAMLGLHATKNAVRCALGEQPQSWRESVGEEE